MNQRVILATLGGAVVCFLVGWGVYGMLLDSFYRGELSAWSSIMKTEEHMTAMDIVNMFISNVGWALLLALIFSKFAGIANPKSGFIAGAWMSIIIACAIDFQFMAMYMGFGFKLLAVDVVMAGFMGGVCGATVGFILGMGKEKAA